MTFARTLQKILQASVGLLCAVILQGPLFASAALAGEVQYKVDPSWPQQLPNNQIMGPVGGLAVDTHNNVWVIQRQSGVPAVSLGASTKPPSSICCVVAPAVLEIAPSGEVIMSWGKPDFVEAWPKVEHAIFVDAADNVWISGNGLTDRQVLKFSRQGDLLLTIGRPSDAATDNQDTSILGRPAGIDVDVTAHEVYIADGYLNSRIVVYDADTGAFKRGWGAYGAPLSQISNAKPPPYNPNQAPSKSFNLVHAVKLSTDGFVYVGDRANDRIQVFTKGGTFVREFFLRPATLGMGTTGGISLSSDRAQKYLFVADDGNSVVSILDRNSGREVGQFGHRGHNAGQFDALHAIAADTNGNIYTGEAGIGMRVQKFKPAR